MSVNVLWNIYDHPGDYPDTAYLARLFINNKPTETCIPADNLWYLRVVLAHNYPALRCYQTPDAGIVEVWMP